MEPTPAKKQPSTQVKISDILFLTIRRWPWLLLSLAICLGIGIFYCLKAQPLYTRTASIVIHDEKDGNSIGDIAGFSDMGFLQNDANIVDEVNKLQSPDIMEEVVKRLHLDMSYNTDGRFHKQILYGSTLLVTLSAPFLGENGTMSCTIELSADGTYRLEELKIGNEQTGKLEERDIDKNESARLGQPLRTPAGAITLSKTPFYTPGREMHLYISRTTQRAATARFGAELTVARKSDKGNTINLTVVDRSAQRATDIINAVIEAYNENWIRNRNQISVATSAFINERLGMIESELGNVDRDISSYKSEHMIPDVTQAAQMYMTENQAAGNEYLELSTRLQMTRYMRDYLADSQNRNRVLPVNSGIGSNSIEKEISDYNKVMLERNSAAQTSKSHPMLLDLDAQLQAMRGAILSSFDNQIHTLQTQIKSLQGSKSRTAAQIAANPAQARYLLSVERQQKVKESLYLFLLQKREENELGQAFTAYNTQVITKPNGPSGPTAPQSSRILAIALLMGLLIPFGANYLLESNNTKVRGRRDIENSAIPFLGEIPARKAKKGEDKESHIIVKQGKRDVVNEAFRVLRTNVGFISGKDSRGATTVMVTSFNPGSGKTFVTMNLGASLAIRDKRVVVIDGDMRRGSTSAYIGKPKTGLSNYLVGETSNLKDIIVADTLVPGLSVIPVGTIPPNPTELLESPRFAQLIEQLRGEYDYILIDCPPVEMMADAQIIERVVDRTLFVVRAGLLDRSMLPELERLYEDGKYKNMGMILNATRAEGSRYGYKYGYGYGYGYGNYSHYTNA